KPHSQVLPAKCHMNKLSKCAICQGCRWQVAGFGELWSAPPGCDPVTVSSSRWLLSGQEGGAQDGQPCFSAVPEIRAKLHINCLFKVDRNDSNAPNLMQWCP